MSEEVQRPRVGCGAAVLDDQGRLLLVKRVKNPEADHWGVPGGKLDWGEAAHVCAERETNEELGITVKTSKVLAVTDMVADDYHWVAITYAVESFEGQPVIQEAHAIHEWGWFALDALPSPMTLGALDAVAALKR
jgi:ADP-ribose pyrophosphatase YjhB (NUDIX family)